jgi:hypothetical protein
MTIWMLGILTFPRQEAALVLLFKADDCEVMIEPSSGVWLKKLRQASNIFAGRLNSIQWFWTAYRKRDVRGSGGQNNLPQGKWPLKNGINSCHRNQFGGASPRGWYFGRRTPEQDSGNSSQPPPATSPVGGVVLAKIRPDTTAVSEINI